MKTILITGANRGIGLALTKLYCEMEWKVIACCRNPEKAAELKSLYSQHKNQLTVLALDVGNSESIKNLAKSLKGQSIDILMNNAGVIGSKDTAFGQLEFDTWLETFKINAIAPALVTQALIDQVAASELRIIANMSSTLASISLNNENGYYYYRTSKAALNMLTKNLSVALKGKKIIVVSLHPGWVKTDMGGENAPLSTTESVRGLATVLGSLKTSDNGTFIDYEAKRLTW